MSQYIQKAGFGVTPGYSPNGLYVTVEPKPSRIANPSTLGLFSFASTTLILSLFNIQTRGIHIHNAVVGMACFCGGLAQFLAGMWEFPRGNTFGATAFSSYGAFWMSYATILIPGSGILAAYKGSEGELISALGIYLLTWGIATFLFFIAALRKNIGLIVLFGFLTITFFVLAGGVWFVSARITKFGGVLGCITAVVAYYVGLAEMLDAEDRAIFRLPLGALNKKIQ